MKTVKADRRPRWSVHLGEDEYAELCRVADLEDRSVVVVVRRALTEYYERHGHKPKEGQK